MKRGDAGNHPAGRLKKMLKTAGLRSSRMSEMTRGMVFPGRTREWLVAATLTPEWLHVSTGFCDVPQEAGLRARLYEHTMEQNRRMNLVKFSTVEKNLVLEADYRAEHVDDAVLASLIGFLLTVAQEQYPAVFRIVSGDDALHALEVSLQGDK